MRLAALAAMPGVGAASDQPPGSFKAACGVIRACSAVWLPLPASQPPCAPHNPRRCPRHPLAPRRYDDNGGTVVAVAGDDYCIVAASTRMSTGYSILTRNKSKILQL